MQVRKISQLILVLSILVLGACSSTKIAYGFLDWVLGWQVNSYVSLNKEQSKFTKETIDDFHAWHRHTQLPIYAEYIKGLKKRLTTGKVTAEQIHAETDQLQIFLDTSIEQLIPALVELAASLDEKQIDEIQKNSEKEHKKYKEKYIDIEEKELFKLREKQLKKHLVRLLGTLTRDQKDELKAWASSLLPYEEIALAQQQRWTNQATTVLRSTKDKPSLEKEIKRLMFYHSENWGKEAEQTLDTNQNITYKFIANVFNSMNSKQKAHLEKGLDDYASDFESLAQAE